MLWTQDVMAKQEKVRISHLGLQKVQSGRVLEVGKGSSTSGS